MHQLIRPGQGFLYMKVGTHAKETLEDIIKRKSKEIEQAGYAMWGYGGNTCHPQTMVQPFARECQAAGGTIYLCMEEMNSTHFAEPIRADEYSADGRTWHEIDPNIRVLGSRYALIIKNLRRQVFNLPLRQSTVAIGNSIGASGDRYIRGRVDKACLRLTSADLAGDEGEQRRIGLVAEIAEPFAVFVRNKS
jgi:hypothetical protein